MGKEDSGAGRTSRRRGLPIGAMLLVAFGTLILLNTTGVVGWSIWSELWRFWPVLLIVAGVNMLVKRRAPLVAGALALLVLAGSGAAAYALSTPSDGLLVDRFTEPLEGVTHVDLQIDFGAGSMSLVSLPLGSPALVDASFFGRKANAAIYRLGDEARIEVSIDGGSLFRSLSGVRWEIGVSALPRLSLDVNVGAANMELDLRDLQVHELDVSVGAADLRLVLPAAAGSVRADVSAGAADINIVIPSGVAASITKSSAFSSVDIDDRRFPRFGDVYDSPGYASALNKIELHISVGAADVTVR